MEKFTSVYDRWQGGDLSQAEAAELLGRSERQFRRYKGLYEEGGLEALRDGRLGRPSSNATPAEVIAAILALYRRDHQGWNVKHFHEHLVKRHGYTLSYSLVKSRLQDAELVGVKRQKGGHRRKRERKPCVGMMLHQDGSRAESLEGQAALDLIVTMDDATSEIYSAFLVEEEGTMSTFRACLEVFGEARHPGEPLHGSRQPLLPRHRRLEARSTRSTKEAGGAGVGSPWRGAHRGLLAAGSRAVGAAVWDAAGQADQGARVGGPQGHRDGEPVDQRGVSGAITTRALRNRRPCRRAGS